MGHALWSLNTLAQQGAPYPAQGVAASASAPNQTDSGAHEIQRRPVFWPFIFSVKSGAVAGNRVLDGVTSAVG